MKSLSIIIPVFNEYKTLKKILNKILKLKIKKQIIVIDDGSTDGSSNILKKYKKKIDKIILHQKNCGKGSAIISAKKYINCKYVIIQDADLEYDPVDILKIFNYAYKNKLHVLYGSRVLNKNKIWN